MMALMRNAKKKEQKKKGKWIGLNNGGERENKRTKKELTDFFFWVTNSYGWGMPLSLIGGRDCF